jgi:hypothetical protein
LFGILSAISWHPLQIEWIEKLFMNIRVWKRCSPADLQLVLRHWSLVLVDSFPYIFEGRQHFTRLISQFRLYFSFQEFEPPKHYIPEITLFNEPPFGDDYTCEDILKCRDLFALFIVRVASISLNDISLAHFGLHLRAATSKQTLLALLSILGDMAPFITLKFHFQTLYFLCGNDIDINVKIIEVVHDIFQRDNYLRMLPFVDKVTNVEMSDALLNAFPSSEHFTNCASRWDQVL